MLSFDDARDDGVTQTSAEDEHDQVDDLVTDRTASPAQDRPADAAARTLELAAIAADQLVSEAQAEAETLKTTAQAEADAILEASRAEAYRSEAELSRSRREQVAELDRERATALAGLAEEKARLEAQIAALRQVHSDHRTTLRRHLTEQLALLDAAFPDPTETDAP
jgi:hypothetical protein